MARSEKRFTTRRNLLKHTGTTAVLAGLAGCIGGGDGGSDSGSKSIKIGIPPLGYNVIGLQYLRDQTDILATEMEKVGYDFNISVTWDEVSLFASGQADFVPTLGDIEGAQLAAERGLDLMYHGVFATNYTGIYVRRGGDWDPANTGSVENSIRGIAEENALYGNGGWGQGAVPAKQIGLLDAYDLEYSPDGDFNVQKADWGALPKLLVNGDLEAATSAPPLGAAPYLTKDTPPIKDIYWDQPGLKQAGFDPRTINVGQYVTRQKFSNNHLDAVKGFMRAWKQAATYISTPDNYDKIVKNEDNVKALGANNAEEARLILEFGQLPGSHTEMKPTNTEPVILPDPEMDAEFIETDKQALRRAQELGFIPDGWEEKIEYKEISL